MRIFSRYDTSFVFLGEVIHYSKGDKDEYHHYKGYSGAHIIRARYELALDSVADKLERSAAKLLLNVEG